jgi:hypothetical protein
MKTLLRVVAVYLVFVTSSYADSPVTSMGVDCNWGKLTAASIAGGFPQGPHSSDPSGDGHGPGSNDEPRAGLANVIDQGNLQALCLFISDALGGAPAMENQPEISSMSVSCNWGQLTMEAIGNGFPQGPHSSDPSGDGHGPGTADEPRAGLANVVNQGDLQALCEFIAGA